MKKIVCLKRIIFYKWLRIGFIYLKFNQNCYQIRYQMSLMIESFLILLFSIYSSSNSSNFSPCCKILSHRLSVQFSLSKWKTTSLYSLSASSFSFLKRASYSCSTALAAPKKCFTTSGSFSPVQILSELP